MPSKSDRNMEKEYFKQILEEEQRMNENPIEVEFKYICFSFWNEQLKGVVGMCNYNTFLPRKYKKPLKTRSILSKAITSLNPSNLFSRKKRPTLNCENILKDTEHQSREFKELLDSVISDLTNGHKVQLYGFSYGGAVLNLLARKIHIIINNIVSCLSDTTAI
jgi:hypothetical protein